jgi:hypothetical protein
MTTEASGMISSIESLISGICFMQEILWQDAPTSALFFD